MESDDDWLAKVAADLGHLSQVAALASGATPDPTMPEIMPEAVDDAIVDCLNGMICRNERRELYAAIRAALTGANRDE